MEYHELEGPDGVSIRVPKNDGYRTCPECGGDCEPDVAAGAAGMGVRIAFICPEHGVHSVVDPFEDRR
ncbi:hypothetical protein JOF28_000286 [Leucobacter exalbidus]|uniref:Uncharacterized protein n=1 Tax=Leucobacter exalbidus TaxID=662960 RepID=A0A940PP79_9MICO|nr:hypothetical protein [Leucobacter exalbidus]MBP1325054.1 hypothetical protein [Leucobacter exalbidus]